jgi:hypothetical protein
MDAYTEGKSVPCYGRGCVLANNAQWRPLLEHPVREASYDPSGRR